MNIKQRFVIVCALAFSFITLSFWKFKRVVFASDKETSDAELLELYEKTDYILHVDDGWIYNDMLRSFLWGIVTALKWVNNLIEESVHKIITMNDFYSSPAMIELLKIARPLVFGLFFIALTFLGFQFMLNKIEKRNEILLNVLMAVSIIVIIPVIMSTANQVLGEGMKYVEKEQGTLAGEMIKSNVADLQYYINKGFQTNQSGDKNTPPTPLNKDNTSIGTTDFTYGNQLSSKKPNIEVNEKLDIQADKGWFPWTTEKWVKELEKNNSKAYDFLLHQRIPSGEGDSYRVKELAKNKIPSTNIGQEAYYRWHVNWGVLIASLLVTTIALIITVVKVGRAIFDLAFHQIFGMFVAVTDLTGGQRTKKVLVEIANTFGVIFVMVFLLKIFMLYSNWVNGLKGDIGTFAVVLMLIAGAWAVIDAPDIVQRIMGIDAGLRSGWQAMMGAYAGAKVAGGVGKGITKGASAISKGAGASYSGIRGMTRGVSGNPSPTNVHASNTGGGSSNKEAQPIPGSSSSNQQDIGTTSEQSNNQSKQNISENKSNNKSTIRANQSKNIPSSGQSKQGSPGLNRSTGSPVSKSPESEFNMSPVTSTSSSVGDGRMQPQPSRANISDGHKEPQFKNTLVGGMRGVRDTQAFMARAENTGFDVGQKIRGIGQVSGKGVMNTARAVRHPVQAAKHVGTVSQAKTKQAITSSVKGIRTATSQTIDKTKSIVKQINTPIGKPTVNKEINKQEGGSTDGI